MAPQVTPAPSDFQGHGRYRLNSVLLFSDPSGPSTSTATSDADNFGNNLYILDNQDISTNEIHSSCFRVAASASPLLSHLDFKVVLSWTDPPPSEASQVYLINDLDLFITTANSYNLNNPEEDSEGSENGDMNGGYYIGNHGYNQVRDYIPWDFQNNMEKITIPTPGTAEGSENQSERYYYALVNVRGHNVPVDQTYSLVVSGQFQTVPLQECLDNPNDPNSPYNSHVKSKGRADGPVETSGGEDAGSALLYSCMNNCSNSDSNDDARHGVCDPVLGLCHCSAAYTGSDCSQSFRDFILDGSAAPELTWSHTCIAICDLIHNSSRPTCSYTIEMGLIHTRSYIRLLMMIFLYVLIYMCVYVYIGRLW